MDKNISEKLITITENQPKVYEAGKRAGKQAEYEDFWEKLLESTEYTYRFAGRCWNDKTFRPTKDIHVSGFAASTFAQCGITDLVGILEECGVTLDFSGLTTRGDGMFSYAYLIKRIPYVDLSNVTNSAGANNTFRDCYELETVIGLRVNDSGTTSLLSAFNNCNKLKNIVIDGVVGVDFDIRHSPLTRASMESIVSALSDTVTGKKVWFKKTAKTAAFTDAEWSALIGTKPNWTFTLV